MGRKIKAVIGVILVSMATSVAVSAMIMSQGEPTIQPECVRCGGPPSAPYGYCFPPSVCAACVKTYCQATTFAP